MTFQEILWGPLGQRLAWTLLHFLWQGLVISAGVAALACLLSPAETRGRYALALVGLVLMACCPLITFGILQVSPPNPVASAPAPELPMVEPQSPVPVQVPISDMTMPTPPPSVSAVDSEPSVGPVPEAKQIEIDWHTRLARLAAVIQPYAITAWLVGVVALSGRLLISVLGVRRLARGRLPVSAELATCATRLAQRLGLSASPGVYLSKRIREAMLVGLWRPMILLPAVWIAEMPPDVLEAVIAHELAHVRRLDLWANLLQRLVETLLFYHPAVWWLSRRISIEREMCADDLAVEATGERMTYASALELLGHRRLKQRTPQLAATMSGRRMALFDRVRNVLGVVPGEERLRWWPAGLLALLVPLGLWLASMGMAETKQQAQVSTAEPDEANAGGHANADRPTEQPKVRQLANIARAEGPAEAIAWGQPREGLSVGIGAIRTSLKSPTCLIIKAYLANRGDKPLKGIIQGRTRFVLELDGAFYAEQHEGGPSGIMKPSEKYGPLLVATQWFRKVPRLEAHSTSDPSAPAPMLMDGRHVLRLYYKFESSLAAGKPVFAPAASPKVEFTVSLTPYPRDEAAATFTRELQQADNDTRREAALAAGDLRIVGCRAALVETLKHRDPVLRRYALESLAKIKEPADVKPVRALLADGDMDVRLGAATCLVELGQRLDVAWVEPIIKSKQDAFQNAIWLVRRYGGDQAVPALIRCLDAGDPSVISYYNYTLVWQIAACGGPHLKYHHDFNGAGTAEQVEENRKVLAQLQQWLLAAEATQKAGSTGVGPQPAPANPMDREVSLTADKMPLRAAIEKLAAQAGLGLEFDVEALKTVDLDLDEAVSASFERLPLAKTLGRLIDWQSHFDLMNELRHGKLVLTTLTACQARTAAHLPDWLKPLYTYGLVARVDDDGEVVELSTGNVMNDQLLARLAALPKLRELHIEVTKGITPEGLAHLGELKSLVKLSLSTVNEAGPRLGDAAIRSVVSLPALRELSLMECGTTDAGAKLLEEMPQLTALDLYGEGRLTDTALESIGKLSRLKSLSLTCYGGSQALGRMHFSPNGIRRLRGLKELETLGLIGHEVPADGLPFPKLTSLSLGHPLVDDAVAARIGELRQLRHLQLSYCLIRDAGLKRIAALPELRQLDISSRRITNEGIESLRAHPRLEHVTLRADVSDKSLVHLAHIPALTRLDLYGSGGPGVSLGRNFSIGGLQALKALPKLDTLVLTNLDLPGGIYTGLKELQQLRVLSFMMCNVSDGELDALEEVLPNTQISRADGGSRYLVRPKKARKAAAPAQSRKTSAEKPARTSVAGDAKASAFETRFAYLQSQHIREAGRDSLVKGYESLLADFPDHPRRAEVMHAISAAYQNNDLNAGSVRDRGKELEWLRKAVTSAEPGSGTWVTYSLSLASYLDGTSPKEAERLVEAVSQKAKDPVTKGRVIYAQESLAVARRDLVLAEKLARQLQEWHRNPHNIPTEIAAKAEMDGIMRNAAKLIVTQWAISRDPDSLKKMEKFKEDYSVLAYVPRTVDYLKEALAKYSAKSEAPKPGPKSEETSAVVPADGVPPAAKPGDPVPNANDPAGNTSAAKEPTAAAAEQRAKALAEETEKRHYQALLGKLKAQIIDAQRAGKTETLSATADSFNASANGRLLYLRVLRVDQYASKDGVDIPSKTTALIDKRFNAWKVPVPAVRYLMDEGPHISRHSQNYRDWLLVENGRLESGRYADDLAIQAAISEKRPDEWPTGSAEVKAAIALLEQPWQTNVTDEELDKAAEKLKPAADEAVDAIMRAFNRSGQQYAYHHRAVQLLHRLGTPKARATLLDIALGRTAEDLPAGKAWASVHYLRIAPDAGDARKLLASDDADVLGNALRRLKGVAIDEDLLKRLVELTAYKTKEPHFQWYIRKFAADVMAADPAGSFAARKVEAILAAVGDVANMPDADKVQKLSTGTNAERYYSGYMRALVEMRGADEALRQASTRTAPPASALLAIARAQRGDKAARKDLYPILNDPQAGLRGAWAADSLAVVGTQDDLPLLKKLADSDALERDLATDVGPPDKRPTYFPVRRAALEAIQQIDSRQDPATKPGPAVPKQNKPTGKPSAAKPAPASPPGEPPIEVRVVTAHEQLAIVKEEPRMDWGPADRALRIVMAGDPSFSTDAIRREAKAADPLFRIVTGADITQKGAIAGWQRFLQRSDVTKEQRVFACWRIGSLYLYNFDARHGETADVEKGKQAMQRVRQIMPGLVSQETLNSATTYGTCAGTATDLAQQLAQSLKWITTLSDKDIDDSAPRINRAGYVIDEKHTPGGGKPNQTIEERKQFLRGLVADCRNLLVKRITEEIEYSTDPAAIGQLLECVEGAVEPATKEEWQRMYHKLRESRGKRVTGENAASAATPAAKPANESPPARDQSATKDGAKTKSTATPARGSVAELNTHQPWAKTVAKALKDFEIQRCDAAPSLAVGSHRAYQIVLRHAEKEYVGPVSQLGVGPGQLAAVQNDRSFVIRYRRVELAAFTDAALTREESGRIAWQTWEDEQPYFKKTVHLGRGMGLDWYACATLCDQELLREPLALEGGDDRLALLTEGIFVQDKGTWTSLLCMSLLARAGDRAIPYVKAVVEKRKDGDKAIFALAYIRTPAATEYLQSVYAAEATRALAAYALIQPPLRPSAKGQYLDMLARRVRVFEPRQNCVRLWEDSLTLISEACVQFQWKDALPLVSEIYLRPKSLREFEAAFEAKRELEGRPVSNEIKQARQKFHPSATQEEYDRFRNILLKSPDTESAVVVAILLYDLGGKLSDKDRSRVRQFSRDVLSRLPRKQVDEITSRLIRSFEALPSMQRTAKELSEILSPQESSQTQFAAGSKASAAAPADEAPRASGPSATKEGASTESTPTPALPLASAEVPPLRVRVEVTQPQWEVNEQRTGHVLKITNQSSGPVTLPRFRFQNSKEGDPETAFYFKEHVLTLQVMRGTAPVSIHKDRQAIPEKRRQFPTVELQPNETFSVPFSLTRQWYSLTEPGEYSLTVILDTTGMQSDKILKGRFASPPTRFRIVPIATFRAQEIHESPDHYAGAWVAFYLHRIEEHKGEYFPNVANLLSAQNAVPTLIGTLDSKDNNPAKWAETILGEIHHPLGAKENPPALPKSKPEWLEWWKREGMKLSPKVLWSNFDSHYQ